MTTKKHTFLFFLTVIFFTLSCNKDISKEIIDDKFINTGSFNLDIKGHSNNGYYINDSRQLNYNNTTSYRDINQFWIFYGEYNFLISQTDGLPDGCNVDWYLSYDLQTKELDISWCQINYNCVVNDTSYLSLKLGGPASSIDYENYLTDFNFDTITNYISGNISLKNEQQTITATGYFQIKVFDYDSISSIVFNK